MKVPSGRRKPSAIPPGRGKPDDLEAEALIGQGKRALLQGDYALAKRCFRQALSQAPFRADVKELLAAALDERPYADAVAAESHAPAEARPPARPKSGGPMFQAHKRTAAGRGAMPRLVLPVLAAVILVAGAGVAYSLFQMRGLNAVPASRPAQSPEIQAMIGQAEREFRQGNYHGAVLRLDDARKSVLDTTQIDEALAEIHYRQAMVLSGYSDYQQAVTVLDRALVLRPGDPKYLTEKGGCQHMLAAITSVSDPQKAREFEQAACETLERALEADPDRLLALWYLGRAHAALDERGQAAEYFRRLIEVHPSAPQATTARTQLRQWETGGD